MPSEKAQLPAEDQPTSGVQKQSVEIPDEFNVDLISELEALAGGVQVAAKDEDEGAEDDEGEDLEANPQGQGADEPSHLSGQLQSLIKLLTLQAVQNNKNNPSTSQDKSDPVEEAVEEERSRHTGDTEFDEAGTRRAFESIRKIAGTGNSTERLDRIEKALLEIIPTLKQMGNESVTTDYETFMGGLCQKAKLDPGSFTAKGMLARIIQEGASDPNFNKGKAAQIFSKLNKERLRSSSLKEDDYYEDKQEDEKDEPPQAHGSSDLSAAEGIYSELTNPDNKDMDFMGDDFTKTVKNILSVGDGSLRQGNPLRTQRQGARRSRRR